MLEYFNEKIELLCVNQNILVVFMKGLHTLNEEILNFSLDGIAIIINISGEIILNTLRNNDESVRKIMFYTDCVNEAIAVKACIIEKLLV